MPYRFSFEAYDSDEDEQPIKFSSNLHCSQCTAKVTGNRRCKRTVCMGLPYCWSHTRKILGLKRAKSTIPNAGDGIFAFKRNFAKGEIIAPYFGEIISKNVLETRYGAGSHVAPYAIEVDKNLRYEDGAIERGIGTLPNDPTLTDRKKKSLKRKINAKFIKKKKNGQRRIFLKAIRHIGDGSEIFVDYGKDYVLEGNASHKTKYVRS